jgi:hypothetical protein
VSDNLKPTDSKPETCDCHSWPTYAELHEYVLAIEKRDSCQREAIKKLRLVARAVKYHACGRNIDASYRDMKPGLQIETAVNWDRIITSADDALDATDEFEEESK